MTHIDQNETRDPGMGEENSGQEQQEDEPGTDSSDDSDTEDEEGFVDIYNEDDPHELQGFLITDDLDNLDEAVVQHLFDRQDAEDRRRTMEQEHEELLREEEDQRKELQKVRENLEQWQRLVQEKVHERDELRQRREQMARDREDNHEP